MEQCKQKIINKYYNEFEKFISLKKIIFGLKEENIIQCADSIINKFDENYPLSFHILISNLICTAFTLKNNEFSLYFNFIKQFDILEKNNGNKSKFSDVFINFLVDKNTRESIYFLENLIEQNFVEPKLVQDIFDPYFLHYMSSKYLNKINVLLTNENLHLEDLSANDFELQKKYAKEGVNPGEIAKIIRNDEIKKLQEISSQTNFDFNQLIKFSYYERCSFVNKRDVTLIDYAAFFSSVKCFKYLLMNGSNVEKTGKYAVAGGNLEIIHLCERNHSTFEGAYEAAIEFHRNDIFKYIYENKLEEITSLEELGRICIRYCNYEILADLFAEGMKINDDIINESAGTGNIYLVKYFLKSNKIPVNILVHSSVSRNIELVDYILEQEGIDINTKAYGYTALMEASIKGYTEIVKLLLQQEGIDINDKDDLENTALIWASCEGHTETVKLLLEQEGIDINAKDYYGNTALIWASSNGRTEIVKLLLEQKGIDINAKDYIYFNVFIFLNNIWKLFRLFNTALIWASSNGRTEIVKLLLEQKGIDIDSKNKDGKTAFTYASEKGDIELVKIFQEGNNKL